MVAGLDKNLYPMTPQFGTVSGAIPGTSAPKVDSGNSGLVDRLNTIDAQNGNVSRGDFLTLTAHKPEGTPTEVDAESLSAEKTNCDKQYGVYAAALGINSDVAGDQEGLNQVQDPEHAQKLHILAA